MMKIKSKRVRSVTLEPVSSTLNTPEALEAATSELAVAKLKRIKEAPKAPTETPIEQLRALVRQHKSVTKTAVAIMNFSRDRIALRDIRDASGNVRYPEGSTIPCSLPAVVSLGYREMVKQITAPELRRIEREMSKILRRIPIYETFLSQVFGLGPIISSYLVSEIDIRKCVKPSQLIRYCGFAVIDGRLERHRAGEKSKYNSELRTRIYQMFSCIWKMASGRKRTKYLQIWLDGKHRKMSMAQPDGRIEVRGKYISAKGYAHNYGWHRAASVFIEDLYTVWRALEGLEVWPSYYAAKLGYEHGGKISVNAPKMLTVQEALALVGDVGGHAIEGAAPDTIEAAELLDVGMST